MADPKQKPPCVFHPNKPRLVRCSGCTRSICDLCTFRLDALRYCPECATEPRSDNSSLKAVLGLILGTVGAAVFVGFMVMVASDPSMSEQDLNVGGLIVGIVALVGTTGGLALGMIATDDAPGGSILGMVVAALNGIMLLVFAGLSVFGAMQ